METTAKQFIWHGIDLNDQRLIMDDPADKAVMSIYDSNAMTELRSLLINMAQNDSPVSDALPDAMRDFVKSELAYPFTDEDITAFKQTHEIWKKEGMKFIFILMFRALPYTYMAEKPANVLKMTKLLVDQPERRIFETAQFVFDVMDTNWWEPDKRGILTALKVRIMHASMRHLLLTNKEGEIYNEAWGKPISQEDLIATNQVFSLEIFKGMGMLSSTLSDSDQKAWFHTWITIGKIMGIKDDLISKDVAEAWTLQHSIYNHLFNDPTVAGIPLAKALVGVMVHFHLPEELTLLMMKRMLADDQFPDCFDRMLGPSYKDIYPDLFKQPITIQEKNEHKKLLNGKFHAHMKTLYNTLNDKKNDYQLKDANKGEGFFARLFQFFRTIEKKNHLFVVHLEMIKSIIHIEGSDIAKDTLEEDAITDIMNAMGGIMVSVLSMYFRTGKNSGFRIPKDLQELWSLS